MNEDWETGRYFLYIIQKLFLGIHCLLFTIVINSILPRKENKSSAIRGQSSPMSRGILHAQLFPFSPCLQRFKDKNFDKYNLGETSTEPFKYSAL